MTSSNSPVNLSDIKTTADIPISPADVEGSQLVVVTHEAHTVIGGGDPYKMPERSYRALYRNGAVLTPRIEEGRVVYDHLMTVQGSPSLGEVPIKRYLTNHGTYAAYVGGGPVTIRLA